MSFSIPLFDLNYDGAEQAAVARVLESKWLTMGEETQAFEREFAEFIGVRHAVATSNCTVALHLAYEAAGVRGGEVILPSLTFVATANAAICAGARPVFADVTSLEDPVIDPEEIRRRITPRTRAICVMHYGGLACDVDRILAIARQRGIDVIEDCAHTPGATLRGRGLGSFGRISCFSFFSNKNLSMGEGGMVCTDEDQLEKSLRLARSHGMTTPTLERHKAHAFSYDVVGLGYNYRLDEIHAAIGREQLKKLPAANRRRAEVAEMYDSLLAGVEGLILPFQRPRGELNHHLFPVVLPRGVERRPVMNALREAGIQSSIHYPPVHLFSFYRERFGGTAGLLPRTEEYAARVLTLPMHPLLTREHVERIGQVLRRALGASVR